MDRGGEEPSEMSANNLPTIVTHNYHTDGQFLANVCDLPLPEAETILARRRETSGRLLKANYIQRRLQTEEWLIEERKRLLGSTQRERPIYFFLGDFADGTDPERPHSLIMPIDAFPRDVLTFTFCDSMASFAFGTTEKHAHERKPYHGKLFTLEELLSAVKDFGLPDRNLPDYRFIEVQVWDERPILDFTRRHSLMSAGLANLA